MTSNSQTDMSSETKNVYDHGADHNNHPETRGNNGLDQTRNRDIHGRTDPTAVAMLEDQDDEGCVIECLSENVSFNVFDFFFFILVKSVTGH